MVWFRLYYTTYYRDVHSFLYILPFTSNGNSIGIYFYPKPFPISILRSLTFFSLFNLPQIRRQSLLEWSYIFTLFIFVNNIYKERGIQGAPNITIRLTKPCVFQSLKYKLKCLSMHYIISFSHLLIVFVSKENNKVKIRIIRKRKERRTP